LLRQHQWGIQKTRRRCTLICSKIIYGKNMKAADATEKGQPVWILKISHKIIKRRPLQLCKTIYSIAIRSVKVFTAGI
jgi:hypothetical protein